MGNLIANENTQTGTLNWQLTQYEFEELNSGLGSNLIPGARSAAIEGYASQTSVYPGESIDFMVSTLPACRFIVDIFRLGYYGGTGGRHMLQLGPFEGEEQPVPPETVERLRECEWQPSVTLRIPDEWISGVYLAKLTKQASLRAQSYLVFVVKQRRKTDILVQVSDLTWQAYNKWPGTSSLYDDGSNPWFTGPNVRVSFDRPYGKYFQVVDSPLSCGSGEFLLWEFPLAYWLEAEGYDVTYCSNLDLHSDPSLLETCQVFISAGHDEYWTRDMYRHASAARDHGVSLLFLSGNAVYHEIIPYASNVTDAPNRSFARQQRFVDEHELMGAASFASGYGDWTVVNPEHWVFAGTGMKAGDCIPGLIGWEYHGLPFKEIEGLEILAHSDLVGNEPAALEIADGTLRMGDGKHAAVIYPGPRNNWVFNAGTIWWAEGLSNPPGHIPASGTFGRVLGPDPRVQQITRNLLARCLRDNPDKAGAD
ncbi:N,N-dimethylformamidase beta subunit family domain-containing protein [Paenibacillus mendelii]|uniref:N,N-dimethylformamidase beta subunit family domain-containing protein n=1 Tax=Paenibacillus mendelii TaxID=206163 RepID=A0ABV6J4M5_9BACL|nr:N,N-dimethylformamidase beta subunit family domain-containing protein [Paenibacillus mendelii]MCQ6560473.1 hypothetical protein [Paenibacillus mendelii]